MKKYRLFITSLILSVSFILSSCSAADIPGYVFNLFYTDKAYISDITRSVKENTPDFTFDKNPFDTEPYNSSDDKYGFNTLNDNQKELYKRIYSSALYLSPVIGTWDLSLTKNDVPFVIHTAVSDHPELFYLSQNFLFLYKGKNEGDNFSGIELVFSDGEIKDCFSDDGRSYTESADRNLISRQISELYKETEVFYSSGIFENDTEMNVKSVHDRVVGFCEYDSEFPDVADSSSGICYPQSNAYGALVKNNAVCSGITAAGTLLLNRLGIDNSVCYGKHNDTWHIWNMVLIGGTWYHMDITWDMSFFPDDTSMYCYEYFLMNDAKTAQSRDIVQLCSTDGTLLSFSPPAADGVEDIGVNAKITAKYRNNTFNVSEVAEAITGAMAESVEYIVIDMGGAGTDSRAQSAISRICNSGANTSAYRKTGRLIRFTGTYFITSDNSKVYLNIMYI